MKNSIVLYVIHHGISGHGIGALNGQVFTSFQDAQKFLDSALCSLERVEVKHGRIWIFEDGRAEIRQQCVEFPKDLIKRPEQDLRQFNSLDEIDTAAQVGELKDFSEIENKKRDLAIAWNALYEMWHLSEPCSKIFKEFLRHEINEQYNYVKSNSKIVTTKETLESKEIIWND